MLGWGPPASVAQAPALLVPLALSEAEGSGVEGSAAERSSLERSWACKKVILEASTMTSGDFIRLFAPKVRGSE